MSVNRVWLLGVVAALSRAVTDAFGDGVALIVATIDTPGVHSTVERHRVRMSGDGSEDGFTTGATVLVEGSVVRDPERRRNLVLADRVAVLTPSPKGSSGWVGGGEPSLSRAARPGRPLAAGGHRDAAATPAVGPEHARR
jgi:hypothetical protein